METMGERLKFCRRAFGWTQEDLAREAGVGIATIRRIEQRAFEPRMETARRLAATLVVRDGWLAFGEEPMLSQGQMTVAEQIHQLEPVRDLVSLGMDSTTPAAARGARRSPRTT